MSDRTEPTDERAPDTWLAPPRCFCSICGECLGDGRPTTDSGMDLYGIVHAECLAYETERQAMVGR